MKCKEILLKTDDDKSSKSFSNDCSNLNSNNTSLINFDNLSVNQNNNNNNNNNNKDTNNNGNVNNDGYNNKINNDNDDETEDEKLFVDVNTIAESIAANLTVRDKSDNDSCTDETYDNETVCSKTSYSMNSLENLGSESMSNSHLDLNCLTSTSSEYSINDNTDINVKINKSKNKNKRNRNKKNKNKNKNNLNNNNNIPEKVEEIGSYDENDDNDEDDTFVSVDFLSIEMY